MPSALDPNRAIEYLGLLSCDIGSVAVFDADGEMLAGEPVDAAGTPVSVTAGDLTITATLGPNGLRALFEHDLSAAVQAMVGVR